MQLLKEEIVRGQLSLGQSRASYAGDSNAEQLSRGQFCEGKLIGRQFPRGQLSGHHFCPLLNVYFNDMQITRWLYLSSSLYGIPLRWDLF